MFSDDSPPAGLYPISLCVITCLFGEGWLDEPKPFQAWPGLPCPGISSASELAFLVYRCTDGTLGTYQIVESNRARDVDPSLAAATNAIRRCWLIPSTAPNAVAVLLIERTHARVPAHQTELGRPGTPSAS